jgi:DNA repair exonuclease SbcCD ATPase subunit
MKRVNFKEVEIRNFLSIGDKPVKLEFKPGLHIITGINRDKIDRRNGIGKTSLIESVYFAIFGTTMRDLKKDLIPNSYTNNTCEVKLSFEVIQNGVANNYVIIRTLNPSKLSLISNGKDITRDSIKNTEEDIYRILNATPSIFENCVIMTLNNTVPFMAKSKVEKRKFIEGIFNLEIFSQMLSVIRDEYSDHKRIYEIELTKFEESQKTKDNLENQKLTILNTRKEKISTYLNRKDNNINEKQKLIEQLGEVLDIDQESINLQITKLEEGMIQCDQKIESFINGKAKIQSHIEQLQTKKNSIGTDKNACPVCLKPVTDHDKEELQREKENISNDINFYNEKLEKCIEGINHLKKKKPSIKIAIDKLNSKLNEVKLFEQQKINIQTRINQLGEWLIQLDEDIVLLKSETTDVDDLLTDTIKRVESIREVVNKHKTHLNLLETVKYIVSEEGVKSYIVNKILGLFNSILLNYLRKMDANCTCFFNEYFEEEIINEKNKICSYFNFSGAERKNIDFACLFTFMDMRRLQGDVIYNISIYDELFDSSLDEKGVELVTNILKERVHSHNECVMVISHRKESIQHATGDVIFLEKKNGVTNKIDYNPFLDN